MADTDSANEFRDGLLQVIDSIPDPVMRESAMRRLRGNRAYRYLCREALPELRNAGYVRIYYDNAPDRVAIVINRAIGLLTGGYLPRRSPCSKPSPTIPAVTMHWAMPAMSMATYPVRSIICNGGASRR